MEKHGPWGVERPPDPPVWRKGLRRWLRPGPLVWIGLLAGAGVLVAALSSFVPGATRGQDGFEAVRLLGLAALVSSGLLTSRRIELGRAVRHAALWAAVLIALVLGYAYRNDAAGVAARLRAAVFPSLATSESPVAVTIGRSAGGGFYVLGQVNGAPVLFLIDTGSSDIVLSPADAARAHVGDGKLDFSHPSETANGVGYGAKTTVSALSIGPIRMSGVPVEVNRTPMSVSLLGMDFLRRLQSFQVSGDRMLLVARKPAGG